MADKQCSHCGHPNPPVATFCGECGRPLPAGRTCPNCGSTGNPPGATYCVQCGASLRRRSFAPFVWLGVVALVLAVVVIILWQAGLLQKWAVGSSTPAAGLSTPTATHLVEEAAGATTPAPTVPPPTDTPTPSSTPIPSPTATPPPTAMPSPTHTPSLSEPHGCIVFDSYSNGNWEVYLMNPDGSGFTNLTRHPANDGDPVWSPDGQRIAFDSDRDGNWEIYVMNADGSGVTRLTSHSADDDSPAWLPDGQHIAFKSNRNGNWEIYVVHLDGSGLMNLTNHPAGDRMPAWSPDGRRVAFTSDRNDNWEIYVMNADGSEVTNLTNDSAEDWFPAWSPDGRRIAFHSYRDGDAEIYVMNADGSEVTRLTHQVGDDWGPSWSSDGLWIAFTSDRDGDNEIYVVRADGSDVRRLTSNTIGDTWPHWAPVACAGSMPEDSPPANARCGDTWVRPKDGATMVHIPTEVFLMGSETGGSDEQPIHSVHVDGFWIDQFEVTNVAFEQFVLETGYRTDAEMAGWGSTWGNGQWNRVDGLEWRRPNDPNEGISTIMDHPVVQVSWNDASAYCEWVGGRLPTEAEWEMAAVGTTGWKYPWGNEFDPARLNASHGGTMRVGSYRNGQSPCGAYDMAGNVWEWVGDWYQSDYYGISPGTNPRGPTTGTYKALRGGGWDPSGGDSRSADRGALAPSSGGNTIGFRCAWTSASTQSVTATPLPIATEPSLTPTPSCPLDVDPQLISAWDQRKLGCPTEHSNVTWAAWEPFEGGYMFWRNDIDGTYVLYFQDRDDRSTGYWEQMPEEWKWDLSNPEGVGMTPPAGLYEPKRGFGWLWRTHLGGPDSPLGWAEEEEKGFCAKIQPFDEGLIFQSSTVPSCEDDLYNWAIHPSFAPLFFALCEDGTWRRY